MTDFLTFKSFISPSILIVFYYMGVFTLPLIIWKFSTRITSQFRLLNTLYEKGQRLVWKILSTKQRLIVVFVFLSMLIMMEIIWRMMFEFLIAYMQIREALISPALILP